MRTRVLGTVALLLGVTACGGPVEPDLPGGSSQLEVGGEVELVPGQTATIPGSSVRVTFVAVAGDSRCPVDVVCVWAGNVEAVLDLEAPGMGPAVRVGVNTTLEPRAVDYRGLTLVIADVQPVRRDGVPIDPDEYRITVRASVSDGTG